MFSADRRGFLLRSTAMSSGFHEDAAGMGPVPYRDAVGTINPDTGETSLFISESRSHKGTRGGSRQRLRCATSQAANLRQAGNQRWPR